MNYLLQTKENSQTLTKFEPIMEEYVKFPVGDLADHDYGKNIYNALINGIKKLPI